MTEPDRIPSLAVSLAGAALGDPDSIRWGRVRGGDLSRTWQVAVGGRTGAPTAIVKWTRLTSGQGSRERRAYAEVLDRLGVRTPALLRSGSDDEASCIVLEDLSGGFRFPSSRHRWTPAELRLVIRAYARLHTEGRRVGRRPWMLRYQPPDWTVESVVADARELRRRGAWGSLTGLDRLAERALGDIGCLDGMSSLLHLDCDPSNAGIGPGAGGEAALIDWDMAGWGAPELDLAYLHLHPFEAAGSVDRDVLLAGYWIERAGMGSIPDESERQIRQWTADRVFALSLVAGARRSLEGGFAPGGRADRYWAAMRPLLCRRLDAMVAE